MKSSPFSHHDGVIHLAPGQLIVIRHGGVVSTVLGSCVAVTMFDRVSGLAAICHAMLAAPPPAGLPPDELERRFRFMAIALPSMIDLYQRAGVARGAIEVKVFGGANVIHGQPAADALGIGEANLAETRRILAEAGLGIAAENTGGQRGRKLLFNATTGEVLHRFLGGHRP